MGVADYRCVSDSSKDTSSNNNGTGNVLDSLTVDDWNWFFPFRFGHKNSNGGSYNSGKEACELLGFKWYGRQAIQLVIYIHLDSF